jgi:hypothetical protein
VGRVGCDHGAAVHIAPGHACGQLTMAAHATSRTPRPQVRGGASCGVRQNVQCARSFDALHTPAQIAPMCHAGAVPGWALQQQQQPSVVGWRSPA